MSSSAPTVEVRSAGGALLAQAVVARSLPARMRGLIGRSLGEGEGMLFPGTTSVHTGLMSYPIDVLYLAADDEVVKVVHAMPAWRLSWGGRRARRTLELPAGTAAEHGVHAGERLLVEERVGAAARA